MSTGDILVLEHVCKSFGARPVVQDVSFSVKEGEIFGFLGPNGAGKTTTIKMILGLLSIDSGSILVDGHNVETDFEQAMRHISGIVENPDMYGYLSGYDNLLIHARACGVAESRVQEVAELVGMQMRIREKFKSYSLGMKQRLGIAMALLGSPKLLILDEPTNGLDPAGIQEMRALIRNMPAATGATVLISSHLLGEMEQMVEQVGIIDHGHILFEGPLTELQRHSRGNVTLRLLDPAKAAPILRANGLTVHSDSCVVTLPPLQDALLADLVQKLAACGAGVVELTPHTKTLEEIFLSLTSEEAD